MNVYQQYAPEAISGIDFEINPMTEVISLPREGFREVTFRPLSSKVYTLSKKDGVFRAAVPEQWEDLFYLEEGWELAGRVDAGRVVEYRGTSRHPRGDMRRFLQVNTWVPHPDTIVDIRSAILRCGELEIYSCPPPAGDHGVRISFEYSNEWDTGNPQFEMRIMARPKEPEGDACVELINRRWKFTEPAGWAEVVA